MESSTPSSGKEIIDSFWDWSLKAQENWISIASYIDITSRERRFYIGHLTSGLYATNGRFACIATAAYGNPSCDFYAEFTVASGTATLDFFKIHHFDNGGMSEYTEAGFSVGISSNAYLNGYFDGIASSQTYGFIIKID